MRYHTLFVLLLLAACIATIAATNLAEETVGSPTEINQISVGVFLGSLAAVGGILWAVRSLMDDETIADAEDSYGLEWGRGVNVDGSPVAEELTSSQLLASEGVEDDDPGAEAPPGPRGVAGRVCPKCGASFPLGGIRFCPACGAPMPGPGSA